MIGRVGRSRGGRSGRRRVGMTLVEVIASLVILSTSVTALVVAQARAVLHLRQCELEWTASEIARELIAGWRIAAVDVTGGAADAVSGMPGWSWRRQAGNRAPAGEVVVREVLLTIEHADATDGGVPWKHEYRWLVRHDSESTSQH